MKLGYGGTKEEMQRLLEDAEKLSGVKYDISSYSDIVDAIHAVQVEMGIAGTSAEEASTTISGSINSLKASWQNLLTGMADDSQDFDRLLNEVFESGMTVIDNLLPRIETILPKIAEAISTLAPKVMAKFGALVTQVLPTLIQGAKSVLTSLIGSLFGPELARSVGGIVDVFVDVGKQMFSIFQKIMPLVTSVMNVLVNIAQGALPIISGVLEAIMPLIDSIVSAVSGFLESIMPALNSLMSLLKPVVEVVKFLVSLIQPLIDGIGWICSGIGNLVSGFFNWITGNQQVTEETKKLGEEVDALTDRVNTSKSSWDNFVDSAQNRLDSTQSEIQSIQRWKDELDELVDANGKVKEGCEETANVLSGRLKNAGIEEAEIVDGQIKKYGELEQKIKDVLNQKRIAAMTEYTESIITEYEAQKDQLEYDLQDAQGKLAEVQEAKKNASGDNLAQLEEQEQQLQNSIDSKKAMQAEYVSAVANYNAMMIAAEKGDVKTVQKLYESQTKTVETENGKRVVSYEQARDGKIAAIEAMKDAQQKALDEGNEDLAKAYAEEIELEEKQLDSIEKEHAKQVEATRQKYLKEKEAELSGSEEVRQWQLQMLVITGNLTEAEAKKMGYKTGQATQTSMKEGIDANKDKPKEAVSSAISGAATLTDAQKDKFYTIGQNILTSIGNGGNSVIDNVLTTVGTWCTKISGKAQEKLQINSPSKVFMKIGNAIPEGLGLGIANAAGYALDATARLADSVAKKGSVQLRPALSLAGTGSASQLNALNRYRTEGTRSSTVKNTQNVSLTVNLDYTVGDDANKMANDIAEALQRTVRRGI